MSEQCYHCKMPGPVASSYRCTGPCGRLFHGKCGLKNTGLLELPARVVFRCKRCTEPLRSAGPGAQQLDTSNKSAATAPRSPSNTPLCLSPANEPITNFPAMQALQVPGAQTLDVASFFAGMAQLENRLGGLLNSLNGKVDNLISRIDSTDAEVTAIRQETTALRELNVGLAARVATNFQQLSKRINDVESKVPIIEATLSSGAASSVDYDGLSQESCEREKRERNIIISGLAEGMSPEGDINTVVELLSLALPGIIAEKISIMRLGVRENTSGARKSPRLIKVVLPSTDAVSAVFRASFEIRQHACYAVVVIRSDRTLMQDAAYRKRLEARKMRTVNRELGLRIVTRNGRPMIITDKRPAVPKRAPDRDTLAGSVSSLSYAQDTGGVTALLGQGGEGRGAIPRHVRQSSSLQWNSFTATASANCVPTTSGDSLVDPYRLAYLPSAVPTAAISDSSVVSPATGLRVATPTTELTTPTDSTTSITAAVSADHNDA